ncbi:MAG: PqqD family protein [Syntrophaceae bacterium]|nr:PqqD family protein [Syntrophaceae bacterium]
MEKYYEVNAPAVISEPMQEEMVVINLENGCYYSLNKMAAIFWHQLEQGCSVKHIASQISQIYGSKENLVLSDFTSFVNLLIEEGLIRERDIGQGNVLSLKKMQGEFYGAPSFEKYSDMQEMLLLDPIHEVSEDGWPHQKKK